MNTRDGETARRDRDNEPGDPQGSGREPGSVLSPEEAARIDPLRESYREGITESPALVRSLGEQRTALLCIDIQYLDAARGHGVFAEAEAAGVPSEAQEYYFERLERLTLPNVARLQRAFRAAGLEVIHTRICSLTRDGRDRGSGHKRLGLHAAPGSKDAEFLPEVAPLGDEIVIDKTASGVFNATNVDYVLRNLGITGLFVVGVYTDECVSTTVRDACDRGFLVTLVEDATATVTPERQHAAVHVLRDRYARVLRTEKAVQQVELMCI